MQATVHIFLVYLLIILGWSFGLECDKETTLVYASGAVAQGYGATSSQQCVEWCNPISALSFLTGVKQGNCTMHGFSTLVESDKVVHPDGSPFPLLAVNVYHVDESLGLNEESINYPAFGAPCVDCEEYVALPASNKLDRIWGKIMQYEYDELPANWVHSSNKTIVEQINGLGDPSRVNMIFDRISDERPPNFPRLFHQFGSIAQVEWIPTDNDFTGLYSEGNEFGVIRISFCAPHDAAAIGRRSPYAFAAKFFRDGIQSTNIIACEGPDMRYGRDPADFTPFKWPVHTSTTIPPPIDDFFQHAQNQTGTLSVASNTWFHKNGTAIENPKAPLIVHFFPNEALNTKKEYNEDFRQELIHVPVNSKLYTGYTAVDDDGNPTICICHDTEEGGIPCFSWDALNAKCNLVELGSLVSRSKFVHSDYGDNGVFFKHYRPCQDRKYCQYDRHVPFVESTFTSSSNRNGTCVSNRRVPNLACPTFPNRESALSQTDSKPYCSSKQELKEKMCPFAKMLHPAFSAYGVSYPIAPDDEFTRCSVTASSRMHDFSLIRIGCCRAMSEFFDASTKTKAIQFLCSVEECREQFESAFPESSLGTQCDSVEELEMCKFQVHAGPVKVPVDMGLVTASCCDAARKTSESSLVLQEANDTSLDAICGDESCIQAFEPLYQRAEAFSNMAATSKPLSELCASTVLSEPRSGSSDDKPVTSGSRMMFPVDTLALLAAVVPLVFGRSF